ncbi:DegT/DnrJ/EryC1/StrS family aminotransferase [Halorarius litoreus]|uniref:DegT/DnrJ/EryC1/StrS family aminotransferase n=1 Tax=Halorarius litoreus TaxID=2962676 RepID=UPI0020CC23B0|nr:DegT/DnrJ/EryC1/StrS family aminotransferase [Halorarius litoreus]
MIPIADPDVGDAEIQAVREAMESGSLACGERVKQFQSEFAAYCGADYGVATTNGTTALHAALHALGIGPGDRVVTTPFSFVATANAVRLVGAEPVFADIDPETYNLDPDAVEAIVREGDVDAILAVHLFGLPADMGRLAEIADEYDLWLIEDAAQAHAAEFEGRKVGSFGDAACFSFYPTKNMTTGEGGMVLTPHEDVADRVQRFIDHGRTQGYEHGSVGHNFRLTDMAAAIGRVQLERLPEFTRARRANAARLTEALADAPVVTPIEPAGYTHVYHQYTVRCADRDALQAHLADHGVTAGVYYPLTIPDQPAYAGYDADVPEARRAAEEVLSLPVHPHVSAEDIETITAALRSFYAIPS